MAITDINLSGKVRADDGTAVSGATVTILETSAGLSGSAEGSADTTDSDGTWNFTETTLTENYDVKITKGSSVRYLPWSDEISLKTVDTSVLKVRGASNTAAAPIYLFADLATDAGDAWRVQATDSDTFAIGSDKASAGTIIDYITITNGANAAASTFTIAGILDVNGTVDWDVTDVQVDSSGDIDLVSTNDAAAAIYLRENAGTSGTIKIHADQGTSVTEGAESINILSDAGGVGIRSTANLANAVNITVDGGTTSTMTLFNDQGTSVTEGAESIALLSDAGGVGIRSTANLANAVNITVDGGTSSTMTMFNDQGTAATEGAASIQLLSDAGGINIKSGLDGANAILLTADAGTSETIVIHADQGTGTGSIELLSDAGGIELDAGTDIILDAGGADIFLKDDGTLFGTLTNDSGELVIKSSSSGTTAATFSGANVTFAGTVDATTDFTIGSTVITDDSIVMTPSTSDTVTVAAATNGVLNITTVDNAAAAANLNLVVDGAVDVDAAGAINLDSGSGIITFEDSGTEVLRLTEGNSGDVTIKLVTNGKDLVFTDNGDATNMKILDAAAGINVPGEVQTTGIGYTDGDNSMTIADGGKVTFAAGFAVGSDAAGDVLYHNGTSYVRLARGSDDEVLTLASGVPSWAAATTGDITGVTAGVGLSGGGSSGGVTLTLDLSELSTVTPADGDFFSTLDSDGSTEQKTTTTALATLLAGTVTSTGIAASSSVLTLDIQNMTASTTIADADLVVIDDGAGGTLRKMTRANFIESAALDAINIDGGAIDGTVIGANTAAAGTFAAIVGTTIDASTDFTIGDTVITDGVITDSSGLQLAANLDIDGTADISGDLTLSGGADGALQFTNAGENSIKIPDNQASALIIEEADNAYITFVTTNSSEAITVAKATTFSDDITTAAAKDLNLGDGGNVNITTPLLATADHTYSGTTAQMLAGGAIAAFDLVCIHTTTGEVVEADASASATSRVIGIAPAAISDTATGTVLLHGFIRDDTWNWTTGGVLFLSETAGAMTHTAPTTDGAFVQAVGIALEPDVVFINPSLDVIEHA